METPMVTTMCATVCRVWNCRLLVCDHSNNQMVVVHTNDACCWRPGCRIRIQFNGVVANSMPPQITADQIESLDC